MQMPNEALDTPGDEGWGGQLATAMGTPRFWEQWMFEAEKCLLAASGSNGAAAPTGAARCGTNGRRSVEAMLVSTGSSRIDGTDHSA